ncbi:MAG: hypothetical protein IJ419_16345 [Agathobacter sp.]|nr:hypothetical protein [Agathobacter sp.]
MQNNCSEIEKSREISGFLDVVLAYGDFLSVYAMVFADFAGIRDSFLCICLIRKK